MIRKSATRFLASGRHEAVLGILLLSVLGLSEWLMPGFMKLQSQLLLSRQLWEFAILALGMTLIIITGGIDLSVGSTMGLCAVAFGTVHEASGSVPAASAACLVTGTVCGLINGILVSRLRVHPLIVTLATFAAYRGIAEGWSQGRHWSRFGEGFSNLARGAWLGVPLPGMLFCVLAGGFAVLLRQTPFGRSLYALGSSERAARFSGIAADRLRTQLFTLSGLLAAIASLIYTARFDTARADSGRGFELDVITAVVLGGTHITGGRGTIPGTVLGLLLIHETRLLVSRYWGSDELRSVAVGLLLISAVLMCRAGSSSADRNAG